MKRLLWMALLLVAAQTTLMAQDKIKDLLKLGWQQLDADEMEPCFETCEKILYQDPDDVEGHILRGALLARNRESKAALADLDYAIEQHTKNPKAYFYRSVVYSARRAYRDAMADLDKAIDLDGKYVEAYFKRACMYLDLGMQKEAMKDCNTAIRLAPTDPILFMTRGLAEMMFGNFEPAIADFQRSLDNQYKFPERAYFYIGVCEGEQNHRDKEEALMRKAIAINPHYAEPWQRMGTLKYESEDFVGALEDFANGLEADSLDGICLANKGLCLVRLNRNAESIPYLDRAVALKDKRVATYLVARGQAKFNLGQYQNAILDFTKAIVENVDMVEAYVCRGRARSELKNFGKAMEDFKMADRLAPGTDEVQFEIAKLYSITNELAAAKAIYLELIRKDSTASYCWAGLGTVEQRLGNQKEAIPYFDKALAYHTNDSMGLYCDRSAAYLDLGKMERAGRDIDSCISYKPKSPQVLSTIGYVLGQLGRYEEALAITNESIAKDSSFAYAFNNRGFAKYKLGQYESAILDFNQSIVLKNDYKHWPPYNRANCLRALGRYKEAIADFDLALSYVENYPEAYNDRGETWEKLGDKDKAIADYRKALEHKPDFARAQENLDRLTR